jgi:hypothetical protein
MKKKFKITFEVSAYYPYLDKDIKYLSKEFDDWIKSVATTQDQIMPVLYKRASSGEGSIEHSPSGRVHVTVEREGEVILDEAWDELAEDF